MTIKQLLHNQPTLTQYTILMRADQLFASTVRRYYGGQLTPEQQQILMEGIKQQ